MPRTDTYFDAMLRHLGAAYYESLHGRATEGDVSRALDTVEEVLHERGQRGVPGRPAEGEHRAGYDEGGSRVPRGWTRRVRDVMTTSVVTVDRITPYKEIAQLLAEHRISGVPVLKMGREVAGVVTEADLVAVQSRVNRRMAAGRVWRRRHQHPALTAEELMTAPAVTISPRATVVAAARLMRTHHIRRLPVVDDNGKLAGIISRRDLLSVFLRPDQDIADDVRRVLEEMVLAEPGAAEATVRNGIVTLTGRVTPEIGPREDLVRAAIWLMWDVDGVVDVIDKLGEQLPPSDRADSRARLCDQPNKGYTG